MPPVYAPYFEAANMNRRHARSHFRTSRGVTWALALLLWAGTLAVTELLLHGITSVPSSPRSNGGLLRRRLDVAVPSNDTPRDPDDGVKGSIAGAEARATCTLPITPFNFDCHIILKMKRADPYLLSDQMARGELDDVALPATCDGFPGMPDHVQLATQQGLDKITVANESMPTPEGSRVLCLVRTTAEEHHDMLQAVRASWGWRCDGFVAFSDADELDLSAVNTPTYDEGLQRDWHRLIAGAKHAFYHYRDDFDWFLLAEDSTLMVMENLAEYISQEAVQEARKEGKGVLLGHRMRAPGNTLIVNGPAGVVLDGAALEKFVGGINDKNKDLWLGSANDVELSEILTDAGVQILSSLDAAEEEVFHPFPPGSHVLYQGGDWYEDYKRDLGLKHGLEAISARSVSFASFASSSDMLRVYHHLYSCREQQQQQQQQAHQES